MNWAEWGSLLGAALAGTVLAITYYAHWSLRYTRAWLGISAEVALALLIMFLGSAAVAWLLSHMP